MTIPFRNYKKLRKCLRGDCKYGLDQLPDHFQYSAPSSPRENVKRNPENGPAIDQARKYHQRLKNNDN